MEALVVTCRSCGAKNRKSPLRGRENPVCGRCGTALPRGGGPLALDEAAFDPVLGATPVPVLVDFWADWCAPCRAFSPVVERFARAHEDEVLVAKVDTEANPAIARRFGIRSIPTAVLFRGGVEIGRVSGALPADRLEAWVRQTAGV